LTDSSVWAIGSVQPKRRERLVDWLEQRGDRVVALDRAGDLPLRVCLARPNYVGIDRLLDAVAANSRRPPQTPAIIIDAGTAVTVDYVDDDGAFRGGTIFPGVRLMAQALHEHTALLPLVEIKAAPPVLGTSTVAAIESGVYYGVAGAINLLVQLLSSQPLPRLTPPMDPAVFLTGGDAGLLQEFVTGCAILWPEMTLEGIRLAAEAQP
jgi:type III pantothenate kinase